MKPLLVTSGEPAGIGPDICIDLVTEDLPIVVLADKTLLLTRAQQLNKPLIISDYDPGKSTINTPNHLTVLHLPCPENVIPGQLNVNNAAYVISMLDLATTKCLKGEFSALVTAPVHKGIINQAGIDFTGHTEFFAEKANVETVVMLLASDVMRVALVTTHLPLHQVAKTITIELLIKVINVLYEGLQKQFGIRQPRLHIAGLNPHAGEGGHLGREEIEIIEPALARLRAKKIDIRGPFAADTMFCSNRDCDAFIAMYHDQGLPILKYASFGQAVNVTLGLPFIRTSVDHGTALELAGTGKAQGSSLLAAVNMAWTIAERAGVSSTN